jgi:hypothetical protein
MYGEMDVWRNENTEKGTKSIILCSYMGIFYGEIMKIEMIF